ncbi:hypothetical protein BK729_06960 [Bacillus thuringiensis serovar wratislaviensis]|nr:hypothetical protein BK729_06960 [Bacillus thuringiensis serovar wratislaviensis]OUB61335.1 hypothetical protein BK743_08260 [Bacillus thuringiensis serovar sylvestriensis]
MQMTHIENKSRAQRTSELSEVIAEGRRKYGEHHIIVNSGTESHPNWIAIPQTPKGAAGIKTPDIFDPLWYRNDANDNA